MAQGKVLVTGGSGFLGINLIRLLHEKGYGLVSLDLVPFDYADMMPHVTGIVGDIRFGPIKMVGGNDVEIDRGSVNLACGAESPYYFEIIGDCATTDSNEQVYGSFVCTSCVRQ